MKIQYYCYTRISELDYCDFISPDLPLNKIDYIRKRILSITNSSSLSDVPKWILIKWDNVVVWGCSCWNQMLAQSDFKDSFGRPVYGFFSMVISEFNRSDTKLPFDIEYFKKVYSKEVEPYWNSCERRKSVCDGYIQGDFNYIKADSGCCEGLLNTDIFRCKSLGAGVDKGTAVAAALTLDNVSLIIDNDDIGQATGKGTAFMNCLSEFVAPGTFTVKNLCPKCKQFVSEFTDAGTCSNCEQNEEVRIIPYYIRNKMDEEMNIRLKQELEDANSTIQSLENNIEKCKKEIKKKNLLIKILCGFSLLLLLLLSYMCRTAFSLNMFEKTKNEKPATKASVADNTAEEQPRELFSFIESDIVVGLAGSEAMNIEYRASVSDVKFTTNVDWVEILGTEPDLTIKVLPYENGRRMATIEAKCGNIIKKLTLTQQ